jgi:hypothetical protein
MRELDWFELHDEQRDDWLDLPYCERCGIARDPGVTCVACGDVEDSCAPTDRGLACQQLEGSKLGGSRRPSANGGFHD